MFHPQPRSSILPVKVGSANKGWIVPVSKLSSLVVRSCRHSQAAGAEVSQVPPRSIHWQDVHLLCGLVKLKGSSLSSHMGDQSESNQCLRRG